MAISGSEKRQRGTTLTIRLSAEERAELDTRAGSQGLAAAAFLRAAALGSPGPRARRRSPADRDELRRLLAETNRVGNNVNQIARALNMREAPDMPALETALRDINAIRHALRAALGLDRPAP